MSFSELNLNSSLRNALADLEYIEATPIQIKAFPVVMSGRDMIGIAQTGTGKTFAYLLPILRQLTFSKDNKPKALIIVPTRELVVQVVEEVEKLTKYMTVRVVGAYGGTNIKTQKAAIQAGVDIVVATPGRLLDLALTKVLRLSNVKKFVIDEVDEMLNLGFRTQLNTILDVLPNRKQSLLFSATMTDEVEKLIADFFINPLKIEVDLRGTPVEQINQVYYKVPNFFTKKNLLHHLLLEDETLSKVLVFVSTKSLADRLYELLLPDFGEQIGIIHSNKSQNFRINTVKALHDGTLRILIATDIIARGLDISNVSHVINFDVPEVPEHYIHRVGRTGRADKKGEAISFVTENETAYFDAIEGLMNLDVHLIEFPQNVEISTEVIPEEIPKMGGDKNYLPKVNMSKSQGAFHEKKAKNMKVNLAHLKRKARADEKKKAKRKKKPRK